MQKYKKIYIEITNVCNLACDFCPRTIREPECMSVQTFSNILDQIKPHTDYIYLHVKGEPLLHPDLEELLDISFAKGFHVNITTNGTLIRKVKDMLLRKPALRQVNFSLHSFDGNDICLSREEYIHDILSFAKEVMDKSKLLISLRLWNLNESNAVNRERAINNELLTAIEKEFALPYRILEEVVLHKGIKIADRIYINQAHLFTWPDLKEEEDRGSAFCYGLRSQAAILVDGTVVPCCLDGEGIINLGNIHETPFTEIVASKRARDIVDGFTRKEAVEELCRKCGYRKRFTPQVNQSAEADQ